MTNPTTNDTLVEPSNGEHARQRFVSVLRQHILADFTRNSFAAVARGAIDAGGHRRAVPGSFAGVEIAAP